MLIKNAEIYGSGHCCDARVDNGLIAAIGDLQPAPGETVIDAAGGALLPGLHDHHVHLLSYAASLHSLKCGPPEITCANELIGALQQPNARDPRGWIRGIAYHESVAGDIDRTWLDRHGPDCPVRIQHRSGRLWIVNSAALAAMAADSAFDGSSDGRLYDQDELLRARIGRTLPPVAEASRQLAAYGVTGITDMTPQNSDATLSMFRELHAEGDLVQRLRLAGAPALSSFASSKLVVGETKIHLHEADLPPFDDVVEVIRQSHERGRAVAVHCVTETELVFTLAAVREAGPLAGDRIEHASVTPPALLKQIRELELTVVTQPNFVAERGDTYLADVPAEEHPWLYRCRSFLDAGIALAAGTDMAFGHADPWEAMDAAVTRRTCNGQVLGADEAVMPEEALALFLGAPEAPSQSKTLEPGVVADLCLLDEPWEKVRRELNSSHVRATFVGGEVVWVRGDCVDEGQGV